MEKLGQDSLDVHEFHRRGLLRDREVLIKPLLRWPRVVQIRVSRYRLLVEQTGQFLQQIPDALSVVFVLGFYVNAGSALPSYIRALEGTTADNALMIRPMPAKPKAKRTGLVLLPVS
jgi:hypothetical protein